jgi:hypothetical protein
VQAILGQILKPPGKFEGTPESLIMPLLLLALPLLLPEVFVPLLELALGRPELEALALEPPDPLLEAESSVGVLLHATSTKKVVLAMRTRRWGRAFMRACYAIVCKKS